MVVAGALLGYQFRELVRLPGRTLVAGAGLGAALMWHLPPLLSWAEADRSAHMFAHASLVVGGGAIGWAVPQLSSAAKAYLFITANAVMWPLVLAELGGGFTYAGYPGQASAAGVWELVAMPLVFRQTNSLTVYGVPGMIRICHWQLLLSTFLRNSDRSLKSGLAAVLCRSDRYCGQRSF